MDQQELVRRLVVALAIGLLIGLERGWQTREERDQQRTAGLRTFALTGLLGGICGLMSLVSSPIVLAAGLLVFAGALVLFSFLEAAAEKNFSVTGVVAGKRCHTHHALRCSRRSGALRSRRASRPRR